MSLRDPRSVLGSTWRIVVGYLAISLSLVLVLEILFRPSDGGLSRLDSAWRGLQILGCSAFGGAVTAWLAGRRLRIHTAIVVALLIVESSSLVATGRTGTSLGIFTAGVALNIAGVVLGAWALERLHGTGASVPRVDPGKRHPASP